jgi:glycine cleavage system transcriptional repressor
MDIHSMTKNVFISISCPDRVGLIAAVTGRLFDLGANLGDTVFAVLGGAAELTTIIEIADNSDLADIKNELSSLPELFEAQVVVAPFPFSPVHGPSAQATHRISIGGGDRPGLVARLSEVFFDFDANIVRLYAEKRLTNQQTHYAVTIDAFIPADVTDRCLATVDNTAGGLGLTCTWEDLPSRL